MAQFTIYKSTDSSAPVLTGQTGKLVDLLDACLVNGYGSKSAAGWAKAFSGTSKAAYRAPSGSRLYYRIQDDGPGAGTFKEARLTGYESMSDVDTGTGPFPTAAQGIGSVAMYPVRKSASADSTARPWVVVADARTCYVFVFTGDNAANQLAFGFGEFYSLVNSDAYNGFTCGRTTENSATVSADNLDRCATDLTTTNQFAVARAHTGTGASIIMNRHVDSLKSSSTILKGAMPYPNAADGGLYMCPVWICDPTTNAVNTLRGRLRGIWCCLHAIVNFADQDTVSGVGDLSGKSFLFLKTSGGSGIYTIETSATLETN